MIPGCESSIRPRRIRRQNPLQCGDIAFNVAFRAASAATQRTARALMGAPKGRVAGRRDGGEKA